MRRGSVVTYADDGRRHSAGMVVEQQQQQQQQQQRRSSSNANRHEFAMSDIEVDTVGGCYVSYRKIAFAFVFFLAVVIAAAFIGVYVGMPPYKDVQDSLVILAKEEDLPEKYALSSSIQPLLYQLELELPSAAEDRSRVKLRGRLSIEFSHNGSGAKVDQLVLNCKHLRLREYRLFELNSTRLESEEGGRHKREAAFGDKVTTTLAPLEEETTKLSPPAELATAVEEPTFRSELKLSGNKTDEEGALYVLFLKEPLRNGLHALELEYEVTVDERTLFVGGNDDKLLLASRLKPENAPRLFPTFDEARLKASFVLTLLHPPGTKALANMPLINSTESTSSENVTSNTFAETQAMPSYNLAFVSGELEPMGEVSVDEASKRSVSYWAVTGRKSQEFYLRDRIATVVATFYDMFKGVAWPSEKLDIVALPLDYDGLSAPGLITVRDSLFHTETTASPAQKTEALLNLLGLVGQQWLGGQVYARNWTDAWYIEGSIIYFQYALLDKIDQSLEASDNFLVDVQFESMESDGYVVSKALNAKVNRSRVEAFDLFENYQKGACLISMLRELLGNETSFTTGYASFLQRWKHSFADSETFLRELASNSSIDGESSLADAFAGWTRQSGYPVINVTWHRDNATVLVRQEKFDFDDTLDEEELQLTSEEETFWWIPLSYVTENSSWKKPSLVWLKGEAEMLLDNVVQAGNESWLVFNVDRMGYYRVNYDEENWRALSKALLQGHMDFPSRTRASLIDDAFSLARQGGLSWERALELIDYVGPGERAYLPWKALARHVLLIEFALYETSAYPSFQEYMRTAVSMLFDEMESRIELGTPLAMLAMQLACLFEYSKCTDWAKNKWEDVLKSNASGDNLPMKHVRETVYCFGARRGGRVEMEFLMRRIDEASDREEKERLLSALGCFQTPWILQHILHEILEREKYEAADTKVILESYARNPVAAQAARRFVQDNWQGIVKRFFKSYWTIKAFIEASTNLLFNDHDLNEFNSFRDQHIDSLRPMGHWVALNEVKASAWISRLKQSSSKIQKSFKSHAG